MTDFNRKQEINNFQSSLKNRKFHEVALMKEMKDLIKYLQLKILIP